MFYKVVSGFLTACRLYVGPFCGKSLTNNIVFKFDSMENILPL